MKKLILLFLSFLIFLTSCNIAKPMSTKSLENVLKNMENAGKFLEIMQNPTKKYRVCANSELLALLGVQKWTPSDSNTSQSTISSMLYFDISSSQNHSEYSRIAIFSNGYAMIQLFSDGKFGEKQFYACSDCDNYYNNLFVYVVENAQNNETTL